MTVIAKGYTTLLLEGVAQRLEDNGIGRYIADTDPSVYEPNDLAIILKDVPAAPARIITLNTYSPQDSAVLPWSEVQVQFRVRAPNTECDDIADAIYGLFHRSRYLDIVSGYSPISSVHRVSSIPLGNDANGWAERTDNYQFGAQRI